MNPEEFSDALDDALPPKPVTKGWGARARRRSRNRRAAGITGVAGAVAVAILAVTSQLTGPQTMTATPAPADPSSPQGPTPLLPEVCRGLDETIYPKQLPDDGHMPEGAQEVWLCGGKGLGGELDLVGAAEPLTLDVGEAVAAFNAEPTAMMAIDCDSRQGETFDVVYAYADGTRYVAEVFLGRTPEVGCNHVSVGGWLRFDPQTYVSEILRLWQRQRESQDSEFVPGDNVCPDKSSVFNVSPKGAVSGFVCVDDVAGAPHQQIQLSDDLVAEIAAEIRVTDSGEEPGLDRSAPSLVLLGEHGDPFTIFGTPDDGYRWYPPRNQGGMQYWVPSEGIRERMLGEIARGLGPSESPTATASSDPTQTANSQPPSPPGPDPAATGSTDAYTEHELQHGLGVLLDSLNGEDPGEFSAVMSRATFRDAWNIASSDVWLAEYPLPDEAPVLVVRIRGPVEAAGGAPSLKPGTEAPRRGAGLLVILDATTGDGVGGGATYFMPPGGEPSGPPPVNPATETDVVQLAVPDPGGSAPEDLQLRAAQECRDIFSEFAPDPAVSVLPDDPTKIWLCLSYAPQLAGPGWTGYGLVTDADGAAQEAVDAFNSLEAAPEACLGGYVGLIAHDYADGSRHVVSVTDQSKFETDGCTGVTLGEQGRDGAAAYISGLRGIWDQSIAPR